MRRVPRDACNVAAGTTDDYVIAAGETCSVREFCEIAFAHVSLNYFDHVVVAPRL